MRDSHLALVVGAAFVSAALVLEFVVPQLGGAHVWYAVGAVYTLTLVLGGGLRHWRARPLGFRETVRIAVVVVIALVPMTPRLFVEWGGSPPPILRYWSSALALHLQWSVPVAFVFPLGAATTRRQRLGTATVLLLPSTYELFDRLVLHPGQFDLFWTTPITLLASTVFWVLVLVALGGLLFPFGRRVAGRRGSL
jgi:hypothetical protein